MNGPNPLEIIDTIHPLRLYFGKHKTTKGRSKILPAWSMGHSTQARTIPVDLARFFIEGALLRGFLFGLIQRWGFGAKCGS